MKYTIWISIPVALWLLVFAVFDAKAADLFLGVNFHHLSHLDVGPPFNDEMEDSVDHLGFHGTIRSYLPNDWELYGGISLGRNFNVTDCTQCWDDGGAEVDTMIFIGVQKKVYSW